MTHSEQFNSAMKCKTSRQAQYWLDTEILRYKRTYRYSENKAKSVILSNLGYIAGYYDDATARKVSRLFGAVHPTYFHNG